MLFYWFPRSGSLLTLYVRLQTAAETKSTPPSSKMWGHSENTVYLLTLYFNLAAVSNMCGIKNVYGWKVTYSIFYITHRQTPCLQQSVGYRQSGWQWPKLYKDSNPQPLLLCCQCPCTELQTAQTVLCQSSCGGCAQLAGSPLLCSCLAHPCVGVLSNFLHTSWCSLWCYISGNSCPHLLLCNWER